MKKLILLMIVAAVTGCQRGKIPDAGDASQTDPVAPPPKEGPRAECPPDTEMQGGPDQLEEWCQKKDGSLQGRHTIWHKNRYKAAEGDYAQNHKQGSWTYWHPNGEKASLGEYRQGKRHGTWSFWHDNSKLAETGDYQEGLEEGKWTSYDENGDQVAETHFSKGMQLQR